MISFSVVIPSKNGEAILRKYLPGIVEEANRAGAEVIVVNDCSTDNTSEYVSGEYPGVTIIDRVGQSAFCRAVNLGMNSASGEYIMVLNNDTVPEKGSFARLVETLHNSGDSVAAVVPSLPRPDGTDDSLCSWSFKRGLAYTSMDGTGHPYPSGACTLWKRDAWEKLDGFDCRYAPIYWEDTDLGARMTGAGLSFLIDQTTRVFHMHASTMGATTATMTLRERNRFIFMHTHCRSPKEALLTALWLPYHIVKAGVTGNAAFLNGYSSYRRWRKGN